MHGQEKCLGSPPVSYISSIPFSSLNVQRTRRNDRDFHPVERVFLLRSYLEFEQSQSRRRINFNWFNSRRFFHCTFLFSFWKKKENYSFKIHSERWKVNITYTSEFRHSEEWKETTIAECQYLCMEIPAKEKSFVRIYDAERRWKCKWTSSFWAETCPDESRGVFSSMIESSFASDSLSGRPLFRTALAPRNNVSRLKLQPVLRHDRSDLAERPHFMDTFAAHCGRGVALIYDKRRRKINF